MPRIRTMIAGAVGAAALTVAATPLVQAQPLPGGSVELPPIQPVEVPVPGGSSAAQLPPLPFPLRWLDPAPLAPPAPRYVASNWIEEGTWCPAPNQRAFSEDGATMWCMRLQRTDGYQWTPQPAEIPWRPEIAGAGKGTEVRNSLGGKLCDAEGVTAVDPSNGQEAYCGLRLLVGSAPVWMYEPGS